MPTPCTACNTFVFSKIGKSQNQFQGLLNLPPLLSDGTRSGATATTALCGSYFGNCGPGPLQTVAEYMRAQSNPVAVSQTPSPKGLVVFFNPGAVCTAGTSPGAILNEATLWHEALHGLTGLSDINLANALGIGSDYDTMGSVAITYYLQINVLGGTLKYFDPGGNAALICKE